MGKDKMKKDERTPEHCSKETPLDAEGLRVLDALYLAQGEDGAEELPEDLQEEMQELSAVLSHWRALPEPSPPSPKVRHTVLKEAAEAAKGHRGIGVWLSELFSPERRFVWGAALSCLLLVGVGLSAFYLKGMAEPETRKEGGEKLSRPGRGQAEDGRLAEADKAEAKEKSNRRSDDQEEDLKRLPQLAKRDIKEGKRGVADAMEKSTGEMAQQRVSMGFVTGKDEMRGGDLAGDGAGKGRPRSAAVERGGAWDDSSVVGGPSNRRPALSSTLTKGKSTRSTSRGSSSEDKGAYLQALSYQKRGRHREASSLFRRLAKDPKNRAQGELYLSWARSAVVLGRYQEAQRLLALASKRDPKLKARVARARARLRARKRQRGKRAPAKKKAQARAGRNKRSNSNTRKQAAEKRPVSTEKAF